MDKKVGVTLDKELFLRIQEIFKTLQAKEETKNLVIAFGSEEANFQALQDGQLGYVEGNIVKVPASDGQKAPAQIIVFKTDGTDPAVQPLK